MYISKWGNSGWQEIEKDKVHMSGGSKGHAKAVCLPISFKLNILLLFSPPYSLSMTKRAPFNYYYSRDLQCAYDN